MSIAFSKRPISSVELTSSSMLLVAESEAVSIPQKVEYNNIEHHYVCPQCQVCLLQVVLDQGRRPYCRRSQSQCKRILQHTPVRCCFLVTCAMLISLTDVLHVDLSKYTETPVGKMRALMRYWLAKATWHRPCVLVLDNIDKLMSAELEVRLCVMAPQHAG